MNSDQYEHDNFVLLKTLEIHKKKGKRYEHINSNEAKCYKIVKCSGTTSGLCYHVKNVQNINLNEDTNQTKLRRIDFLVIKKSMEEEQKVFIQMSFKKRNSEYDNTPPTCHNSVKRMILSFDQGNQIKDGKIKKVKEGEQAT
ncbi:hypothetical protein A3Q56_02132 [Intoshia linei]|uniref:Uncharacterized protein n=1 Tax=Intoshia linei TaxID=1819745 RepID=A0A177B8W5_9BILA|nr:hypothetical protein A3Q56_02132 [Intoshia linei]